MKRSRVSVPVLLAVLSACQSPNLRDDFESKPWEAQKSLLPSYPRQENLVRIYVSSAATFEFFVDPASVSVGQDGVVRYTLIARSPSAAMNVSYEGMRCQTYERKIYALGRSDGTWSQARDPQWTPIGNNQVNRQHTALAEDFFCSGRGRVSTTEDAVQALGRGNQPRKAAPLSN
ncbi:MAG TPA: CNP1-like family protein [Burkholderiales bacterium]|nr:CNP1-like family protein [Burkholderiales bacterium]